MHMASVALVALMVYVYGYLVPDYFRWLHDTAKRNRAAKSGAQVPAPSAPQPTSGFFDRPHPSAPPAPRNLWGFFPSAPPSSLTNWGSGYAAVSTTPD